MAIQSNDPKITLVAGGYPLFVNGNMINSHYHSAFIIMKLKFS